MLIGYMGDATSDDGCCRRSPPPLPPRLVLVSTPRAHSAKPPLDAVESLVAAAPQLLRGESDGGSDASAAAWRELPKAELYAREVRPGWHAFGNEALHFQSLSFYEERL